MPAKKKSTTKRSGRKTTKRKIPTPAKKKAPKKVAVQAPLQPEVAKPTSQKAGQSMAEVPKKAPTTKNIPVESGLQESTPAQERATEAQTDSPLAPEPTAASQEQSPESQPQPQVDKTVSQGPTPQATNQAQAAPTSQSASATAAAATTQTAAPQQSSPQATTQSSAPQPQAPQPQKQRQTPQSPQANQVMVGTQAQAPQATPQPAQQQTPTSGSSQNEDLSRYTLSSGGVSGDGHEIPLEKRNKMLYIIGIVVSLLVMGASGTFFYLRLKQRDQTPQEVETEVVEEVEQVAEASPSPTPTPLPRDEVSLEILNGSGVAGAAAKTKDIFEDLGYEEIEIGNADLTEGSKLYLNPDYDEEKLALLLADVEDELEIASVAGELEDSDFVARIVLGK